MPGKPVMRKPLSPKPASKTVVRIKPTEGGLASGLTKQAIKVYEVAKAQRREQARVD